MQQRAYLKSSAKVLLVAVSFEPAETLRELADDFPSFEFISDPARELYRLYAVESGAWRQLFAPRTIWHYARAFVQGRGRSQNARQDADVRQLGGDFVIDAGGIVRLAHRSTEPADRPSAQLLEQCLRACRR